MIASTAIAVRHAGLFHWLLAGMWVVLVAGVWREWWRPSGNWLFLLFLTFVAAVLVNGWSRWRRERVIREEALPQFLKRKLRQAYPHLEQKDADLVERGLRQFFLASHRSRGKFVAMPSRAVDAMWHEFILHTQAYRDWCALALGRFLHHTPAEVLGAQAPRNDGLRRAWYWACRDEAIDPRNPTRLPLLFALDTKLAIADGFRYVPDCGGPIAVTAGAAGAATGAAAAALAYCATSFGDASASGDSSAFGGQGGAGGDDDDDDDDGDGCGGSSSSD